MHLSPTNASPTRVSPSCFPTEASSSQATQPAYTSHCYQRKHVKPTSSRLSPRAHSFPSGNSAITNAEPCLTLKLSPSNDTARSFLLATARHPHDSGASTSLPLQQQPIPSPLSKLHANITRKDDACLAQVVVTLMTTCPRMSLHCNMSLTPSIQRRPLRTALNSITPQWDLLHCLPGAKPLTPVASRLSLSSLQLWFDVIRQPPLR